MTQDRTSVGNADGEDEGESIPLAEPVATDGGELGNLLGEALLDSMGATGFGDTPDTDADEGDDSTDDDAEGDDDTEALSEDAGETDDDEDEGDEPESQPSPSVQPPTAEQLASWVDSVATTPKSINRIPLKHHPAVIDAVVARERGVQLAAVEAARSWGQREGRAAFEAELQDRILVETTRELEDSDPAGYVQWRRDNRDRARKYDELSAPPRQVDPGQLAAEAFAAEGRGITQQLRANPRAFELVSLDRQAHPERYTADGPGLRYLTIVADRAFNAASAAPADAPATVDALEKRRAARESNGRLPRPDVSPGKKSPKQLSDDPFELISAGLQEAMRGPGAKQRAVPATQRG